VRWDLNVLQEQLRDSALILDDRSAAVIRLLTENEELQTSHGEELAAERAKSADLQREVARIEVDNRAYVIGRVNRMSKSRCIWFCYSHCTRNRWSSS
jgi:hypothetical protein